MKRTLLFTLFLAIASLLGFSQENITQTIRGKIVDAVTLSPLPGASIILIKSEPLVGTSSALDGSFRLDKTPLGRQSIRVSYIGYESKEIPNILVSSGHEVVLNIKLTEQVFTSKAVEIIAKENKGATQNEMTTVSGRTFSIEETNRYAGSLGDPARMAQNFAGVMSAGDARNDIVIRGNSPTGLLWRLDDIDIYNPNHFGALGTTGGPVSILNNNLLSNSDFFTGAFPAEYGNAVSGVFDLNMRSGNNEQHEFVGAVGFNGFELGAEGPFSKNSNASYLIDYRYSTLAVFSAMGLESVIGSSIPQYQDLTFKVNIPTKKYGRFSLFGMGGKSYIKIYDSEKDSNEFSYGLSGTDTDFGSDLGILGFNHVYYFNPKTRIKTSISAQSTSSITSIDSLGNNDVKTAFYRSNLRESKLTASTQLLHKASAKNVWVAGLKYAHYYTNYKDSVFGLTDSSWTPTLDVKGQLGMLQGYAQWKHRFHPKLSTTLGLHYQYFSLNGSQAIEPRAGLKWNFADKQSFSLGYGLHSITQPKAYYFLESTAADGSTFQSNIDLDFTKSHQIVAGYDYRIGSNFRMRMEAYYQQMNNVPVVASNPHFSLLNEGAYFAFSVVDSLENKGTGQNYGVELTLEKFLSKNYYFLLTASLFDSKYTGYNGDEHHTIFANNYVLNALGGYEYSINDKHRINVDLKGIYAGGLRYIPHDEAASVQANEAVYIWKDAYTQRLQDYFRIDLRISYRMNMKKLDQEWALEIQNVTNQQNVFQRSWNPSDKKFTTDYQQGIFPMFLYRIFF